MTQKVNELRPITLTNVEEQIEKNGWYKETQTRFTTGAKIENNILILRYCIDKTIQMKKKLIIISIDFAKAFDSIKRDVMIKLLMEYKVNHKVIDIIA